MLIIDASSRELTHFLRGETRETLAHNAIVCLSNCLWVLSQALNFLPLLLYVSPVCTGVSFGTAHVLTSAATPLCGCGRERETLEELKR